MTYAVRPALDPDDHRRAACRGLDPAIFHPDEGDNGKAAKAVCRTCPTRVACLTAAVAAGEHYGVWGGAGEKDRRPLRRAWLVGGVVWDMAAAAHFDALDDGRAIDVTGEGGTHGRRGRYAKGCRCIPCSLTAVMPDGALAKIRTKTAA